MQAKAEDTRDGITWFDDRLGSVACIAAIELDSLRLGRPTNDWHVRALAGWLLDKSRDFHSFDPAAMFLPRLMKHLGRQAPKTRDDIRPFAFEVGTALFQSITFDPSLNGWKRIDLIRLCVDVSKLASVDRWYGRSRSSPGRWRGVDWYRSART